MMSTRVMAAAAAVGMLALSAGAAVGPEAAPAAPQAAERRPALLLIDPESTPHVEMWWETGGGERVSLEGDRAYAIDAQREPLGENVECYVAVGGTRLTKGAGHPKGAIVRVGFYKTSGARAFFRGLEAGGRVHVRLSNVRFNQPVEPQASSPVQHLKYALEDLESCGLPGTARDQFTTVDPEETLNDRIRPGEDTRAGALSGSEGSLGSVVLREEADGSVTMEAAFAYPLMRHMSDPWQSDLPGTFLEPIHFHIEFEVLPEGVAPLDVDALRAEAEALRERLDDDAGEGED